MMDLTDKNFQIEVLEEAEIPVLIDLYADWCGPCKMATPVIEELAEEYTGKIKFAKLDVDRNPLSSQKYHVLSIPTVIIFQKGEEIKRMTGFPGKEGYQKLIEEVLK